MWIINKMIQCLTTKEVKTNMKPFGIISINLSIRGNLAMDISRNLTSLSYYTPLCLFFCCTAEWREEIRAFNASLYRTHELYKYTLVVQLKLINWSALAYIKDKKKVGCVGKYKDYPHRKSYLDEFCYQELNPHTYWHNPFLHAICVRE